MFFSRHYKDGTIETAKCSKNKLKQNLRDNKRLFQTQEREEEKIILLKI